MKPHVPYDPEDIESLMLHKSFDELYPEEREFVLRHVSGPEEYESMRKMWHELNQGASGEDWLEPDPAIRQNLMALFPSANRGGFRVWLNTLFSSFNPPQIIWYRRPAVQFVVGLAVIAVAVWIAVPDRMPELAELRREEKAAEKPAEREEVLHDSLLPQSPRPVESVAPAVAEVQSEEMPLPENEASDHTDNLAEAMNEPEEVPAPMAKGEERKKAEDNSMVKEKTLTAAPTGERSYFSNTSQTESATVKSVTDALTEATEAETNPASASLNALSGLLEVLYTAR
ncbi:MAG: hypothetical protein ACK500_00400 [Flavobacteriales bacterium]